MSIDYWRLADRLSVVDAAILISGNNPSQTHVVHDLEYGEDLSFIEQTTTGHRGFEPIFKALKAAILSNYLPAALSFPVNKASHIDDIDDVHVVKFNGKDVFKLSGLSLPSNFRFICLQAEPDWDRTTIEVDDLREWLEKRKFFPEFFFPEGGPEDFMNPNHPRYSSKLACAVAAWKAVAHPMRGKSVKQTLKAWIAEHSAEFRLDRNGEIPDDASEQISVVANWETRGGAPKTGGQVSENSPRNVSKRSNYEQVELKSRITDAGDDEESTA